MLFSVFSFFNNRSENIRKIQKNISICISFNIPFFFGCGYLLCWKISQFLCGCLCLCISCAATRMGRDDGGNLIDEYCCPDVNVWDQAYNSQDAWTMYLCKWIPKARIKHRTLFLQDYNFIFPTYRSYITSNLWLLKTFEIAVLKCLYFH